MRRSLRKLPQAKDRAAVRLATGNVGLYRLGYRTMSAPSSTERRRCSMCRKFKPLSDFPVKNKARGTLRSYCRDCCRVYAKRHYQRNRATYLRRTHGRHHADRAACRALAYEYLATHPCVDCGETELSVLDFDHRDGSTKSATINELIRRADISRLRAEMEKCDVRCANDHRRKTARDFGYARWLAQNEVKWHDARE